MGEKQEMEKIHDRWAEKDSKREAISQSNVALNCLDFSFDHHRSAWSVAVGTHETVFPSYSCISARTHSLTDSLSNCHSDNCHSLFSFTHSFFWVSFIFISCVFLAYSTRKLKIARNRLTLFISKNHCHHCYRLKWVRPQKIVNCRRCQRMKKHMQAYPKLCSS